MSGNFTRPSLIEYLDFTPLFTHLLSKYLLKKQPANSPPINNSRNKPMGKQIVNANKLRGLSDFFRAG